MDMMAVTPTWIGLIIRHKLSRSFFLIPALFSLFGLSLAAEAAADFSKMPVFFCESASDLLRGAKSCGENLRLAQGAERCFQKLENLEKTMGLEGIAIAGSGHESQLSQVNAGSSEYNFSDQAMLHLIAISQLALKEIEPFSDYLLAPTNYYQPSITGPDPATYAKKLDCHGGVESRILSVRRALLAKIAHLQARQKEAQNYLKSLNIHAQNVGSAGVSADQIRVQAPPSKLMPIRAPVTSSRSNITGVEEDQSKRAAAPSMVHP
jgi:hypothetical protein